MRSSLNIEEYASSHPNAVASKWPPLLEEAAREGKIVDLGCGDGSNIRLLLSKGLLKELWAVDLSENRVRSAEKLSPLVTGVISDATNVFQLNDGCADGVIASQLIEHIPERKKLVHEMNRLLSVGGWWYVGSVARSDRAWWIYKVDGVRRLDPTHTYEYKNLEDFLDDLRHQGMKVEKTHTQPVRYSLRDISENYLRSENTILKILGSIMRPFGFVSIRVPGYTLVEAAGTKTQ
jgi:2-polyprenyl-3-methyl-5-hydroxy-6-metoxy-1,4-benzoquinol methylase